MQFNRKDLGSGALFVAIGLFFGLNAWLNLRIGQAFSMGPGYFPIVLSLILVAFGVAIILGGIGQPSEPFGRVPWRGLILVLAAVVFFAVTVRGIGIAPALFVSVFMAGMSSGRATVTMAVILALVLSAFSVLIFVYALGLPYPVIGPWLGGR